jgi:hypothetical protein
MRWSIVGLVQGFIEPGILKIDVIVFLIDDEAVKGESVIVTLESHVVFSESTQQSSHDLLDFPVWKGSALESALVYFLANSVAILPIEDKVEVLLVRTVASVVRLIVGAQSGDGLALGALILLNDLQYLISLSCWIGCDFVEEAELLGLFVQQKRLCLRLVVKFDLFTDFLLYFGEGTPHL